MSRPMLDTCTCIDLLRGKTPHLADRFQRYRYQEVAISAITLAELCHGAEKSRDPKGNLLTVLRFLLPLEVLSFDHKVASAYGKIRAALERAGKAIGPLDTLIAAHAVSQGMTLVTSNEREFRRVEGLRVENWA